MKQDFYDIIVLRTASETTLKSSADDLFKPAAAAIKRLAKAHSGVAMAHLSRNNQPLRTAQRLARMVGCEVLREWDYWGADTEFVERVLAACPQGQLFVLVGHEPTVDNVLKMGGGPIRIPETLRLVPFTLRLTVTRRLLRGPVYEMAFVA
jgi:hypothetical protein